MRFRGFAAGVAGVAIVAAGSGTAAGQDQAAPPRPTPVRSSPPATRLSFDARVTRAALEYPAASPLVPIPLDPNRPELGQVFDPFRLKVLAKREAERRGTTLDLPTDNRMRPSHGTVVVALPFACGGHTARPVRIRIVGRASLLGSRASQARRMGSTELASELLPGLMFPEGLLIAEFAKTGFSDGDVVRLEYDAPACDAGTTELELPLRVGLQGAPERVHPAFPAGPPVDVRVRAVVDPEGTPRVITIEEGPAELHEEALRLAAQWRFPRRLVNGVATPFSVGYSIGFGAPAGRGSGPPRMPAGPPGSVEGLTRAVEGLTAETSRCAISPDASYGSEERPIPIGGGERERLARVRSYLMTLRGPAGEGLRFREVDATVALSPMVTRAEVFYASLEPPVTLFFDARTEGPLFAPRGFTCDRPLPIR